MRFVYALLLCGLGLTLVTIGFHIGIDTEDGQGFAASGVVLGLAGFGLALSGGSRQGGGRS